MTDAENTGNANTNLDDQTKVAETNTEESTAPPRMSVFKQVLETIKFIEKAEREGLTNIRVNDKTSILYVLVALAAAFLICVFYVIDPNFKLICMVLAAISDICFGFAILWFVMLRFGVIRMLEPRHALLCWQLMLGSGVLLAFYTMNIAFAFFSYFSSTGAISSN